ncbi:hypothetical protein BDQ17DRAFT_1326803 [Cyathus striatus]|nr:hypothetical protein BDQ17DRAFT_1326803 [Cyathus striatus]
MWASRITENPYGLLKSIGPMTETISQEPEGHGRTLLDSDISIMSKIELSHPGGCSSSSSFLRPQGQTVERAIVNANDEAPNHVGTPLLRRAKSRIKYLQCKLGPGDIGHYCRCERLELFRSALPDIVAYAWSQLWCGSGKRIFNPDEGNGLHAALLILLYLISSWESWTTVGEQQSTMWNTLSSRIIKVEI